MLNKLFNTFLDHPFLAAIAISDFFILLFHKPPFIFTLVMFGILIAYCLFLGQQLKLFKA